MVWRGEPFTIARTHWRELAVLTVFNMYFWHTLAILAIQSLSSGRAAILGYTMPVFSAVIGALWFGQRLIPRAWIGVAAAALGVVLLLWHEFTTLSGRPLGVAMMLVAAATWAVGTQLMRRTRIERAHADDQLLDDPRDHAVDEHCCPSVVRARCLGGTQSGAMGCHRLQRTRRVCVRAGGLAHAGARSCHPIASSLSVMMIPVLGVFSGAWWLGEVLHWQDWAAVLLVMLAILTVLWPGRKA